MARLLRTTSDVAGPSSSAIVPFASCVSNDQSLSSGWRDVVTIKRPSPVRLKLSTGPSYALISADSVSDRSTFAVVVEMAPVVMPAVPGTARIRANRSWNAITTPVNAIATMSLVLRPRVSGRLRDTSGFGRSRGFERSFSAATRGGGSAKILSGALAFSGFGFSTFGFSSLGFSTFDLSAVGNFFATTGGGEEGG